MRRPRTSAVVLAAAVAAAASALVASSARDGAVRRAAKRALAAWATRQRLAARVEEPAFAHLAASQVGYAPGTRKQFTSPRPFASFRVVRETDGATVLDGGPPGASRTTDLLGAIDRVWIGDFSALAAPGRYRILADNGLASLPFEVGADVFDRALRAVQRAFYYQRAFTSIDAAHAEGPWVHASDAALAPPGVRQGWHDAGDFSIYSSSLNTALFWLLEAYADFAPTDDDTNIPESGNGIPDLLDEARWGLEWLLSVQDGSGGFRNTTCETRYGRYGTNHPERAAPYVAGEIGTLATARAIGNLARAATIYRRYDPAFADRCLEAARAGWRWLEARPGEHSDGPTCPAHRADGDATTGRHVRMFAAAGMLLATGEPRFRDAFEEHYVELDEDPSFKRLNGFAALMYLRAPRGDPARKEAIRARLRALAAAARRDGDGHPFQLAAHDHWGSIGAGFTRVGASSVKRCLEDAARNGADCEQALADVHYAFGRNLLQLCYVSGLPGVTRARRWAFHHWLAALRAEPHLFPGMVAGGPYSSPEAGDVSNPSSWPVPVWGYWGDPAFPRDASTPRDARYTDNDSWATNEVSVDWQASAVYVLHFARRIARGRPVR